MKNKYLQIEEVPVWQQAHQLVLEVYKVTQNFPQSETYGLISQLRRASASIPANITEGFYRNSTKELLQFLYTSRGSYGECLYHLRLSRDLGYLQESDYQHITNLYEDTGKQLNGWIKSLKNRLIKH